MKRILSAALSLCLCMSAVPAAHAWQDGTPQQNISAGMYTAAPAPYAEGSVPTPQEAYEAMTALKKQTEYAEGASWDNGNEYTWKGGTQGGIAAIGAGCVAFAYILSDAAFGDLPARMTSSVRFSDVKVGDILRVNNDAHTVIVLQVSDAGVVIAEGNYHENGSGGMIHWGRAMSRAEVEAASHYITRYPENYTPPTDPDANTPIGSGGLAEGLKWSLTKAGTLTISGSGAMADFSGASEQPWNGNADSILNIVVENGVTAVGSNAFNGSKAISATIPASVKTIGSGAFQNCKNLISVTVSEGVERIGDSAFQACTALKSIDLPASISSVGTAAFWECTELLAVRFSAGSQQVSIGDSLFSRCYKLGSVTLPKSIDRIGNDMFMNCLLLSTLNIPQGAASIGERAFSSCFRLASISVPDSVKTIGIAAFQQSAIQDIYYSGSAAQWSAIQKLGDVPSSLQNITVHYNSSLPDPGPNPDPDPAPDPDPDPDPGHEHTWDSGKVTAPADCTSSGVRTYTCTECGETRTETIPAAGHHYEVTAVTKEATCTEAGERTASCSNCGDVKTEIIPAAGHSYGPVTVTREAACTADGAQTSTCSRCGSVQNEIIRALGHSFIRNADGDYVCVNEQNAGGEPATVVSAAVADGYAQVRADTDRLTAGHAYQTEASAREYASSVTRAALSSAGSSLQYTINTVQFTPPTQTVDGEFVYTVTLRLGGRAAAAWLTTEPFYMVIPADGEPEPDPAPDPGPDIDREVYYLSIPRSSGGEVIPSVRRAAQGDRVTLTVLPDAGYELSDLTVSEARGRKISVWEMGGGFIFTMPPSRVTVNAVFSKLPEDAGDYQYSTTVPDTLPGTSPGASDVILNPSPMNFSDVSAADWFYSDVRYCWQRYLMTGVSDTRFDPQGPTNRAMIWTVIARLAGRDTSGGSNWYERGQIWAKNKGITDGTAPLADVTREQLVTMLWRFKGSPYVNIDNLGQFKDAAEVSGWAVQPVRWAVANGLLNGASGSLIPQGRATRAEVAAILARFCQNVG